MLSGIVLSGAGYTPAPASTATPVPRENIVDLAATMLYDQLAANATVQQAQLQREAAMRATVHLDFADAEVASAVREVASLFKFLGAEVDGTNLDWLIEAARANGLMTQADGAAYHHERMQKRPKSTGKMFYAAYAQVRLFRAQNIVLRSVFRPK